MTIAPESVTTLSEREQFCAVIRDVRIPPADAIVLLAGEDARPRAEAAAGWLGKGGGPFIVVTGKRENSVRHTSAFATKKILLSLGVASERILLDEDATNTRQQALNVLEIVRADDWHRLLIVASPYHAPRAMLTFVQALKESDALDSVHVINAPARHVKWWEPPVGAAEWRFDLMALEFEKIERYQALGHVASYADGLAYLRAWESR